MTVRKLIEILESIPNHRMKICVDKDSLCDGQGTFNICDIEDVEQTWIKLVDGDGYGLYTSKGQERGRWVVNLRGSR